MTLAIKTTNLTKQYYRQEQRTFKELIPALFKGNKAGQFIQAIKNLNLEVKAGETLGIIGANGAGKSTLLKLIAGVTEPTQGNIQVQGKISPLIELGAGFHPELTGKENIYLNASILGISKKQVDARFDDIVRFAEIKRFINTPVKHYSSGMYMRLGFSIAVNVQPNILLIDEILAVGDVAFQEKCLKKMAEFKHQGVTIIFVSHALETVASFCSRVVMLQDGKIMADGQPEKVVAKFRQSLS